MSGALKEMARRLGFKAIVKNWNDYENVEWLAPLIQAEEEERKQRAFERHVRAARIGPFKPISDFNWSWPKSIDREQVEELFSLDFVGKKSNVIFVGTNGVGKTLIAQNLAHTALTRGITTRFVKASEMLNELIECDGGSARRRCLKKYCNVPLLVIDEVGYLSYDNRFADLLYEVISGRYERHSTIVTTNRPFSEWGTIFPHAACAVTLVDRLLHRADCVLIEGKSYREKDTDDSKAEKLKRRKRKQQA